MFWQSVFVEQDIYGLVGYKGFGDVALAVVFVVITP